MSSVTIREVGPRDGLQREEFVSTDLKLELIRRLIGAGCCEVEATSFVSPKWVPQFADAEDLAQQLPESNCLFSALVPNQRGLDGLLSVQPKIGELCFFIGATDGFNKYNVNRTTQEHLDAFRSVMEQAQANNLKTLAYVSVVCGCPYDGDVAPLKVAELLEQLSAMGFERFSLGDTIGIGTPKQVSALIATTAEVIPVEQLAFHGHDTYGRGVANAWAAYQQGVRIFDSSTGGLGGCPYAPGAKGNVATEDLVDLFERSEVESGIDLVKILETIDWMRATPGFPKEIGGARYKAQHRASVKESI